MVFRSKESKEVFVLDAFCPHLGANLGIGGIVKDDCIECPFHMWKFRGVDGECCEIPYSEKGLSEGKTIIKKNLGRHFIIHKIFQLKTRQD